ncbi:50S ribosomal protein L24 [Hymenobacter negativus]|uniref:Large ribosomal subunit protein uL24 n=1 Tax=Hymenobacter negativus TaxID=2795026 RepID=A0ABS0QA03_9BACT|nr:50S ribosomal protein L24 [Hymenobacter negativus]MBH8559455.1 50S ribosomal protein L24 [Hymenobacter negativus]
MAIKKADPVQLHVKSGDTVKVIAGDEKGKTGVIKSVNRVTQRVIVEGLNLATKHNKPSAKSPQGGITKIEAPIHVSNVQAINPTTGERVRKGAAAAAAPAAPAKAKRATAKKTA